MDNCLVIPWLLIKNEPKDSIIVNKNNTQDIEAAVGLLESENCDNVITGSLARKSPYYDLVEIKENGKVQVAKELDVILANDPVKFIETHKWLSWWYC